MSGLKPGPISGAKQIRHRRPHLSYAEARTYLRSKSRSKDESKSRSESTDNGKSNRRSFDFGAEAPSLRMTIFVVGEGDLEGGLGEFGCGGDELAGVFAAGGFADLCAVADFYEVAALHYGYAIAEVADERHGV